MEPLEVPVGHGGQDVCERGTERLGTVPISMELVLEWCWEAWRYLYPGRLRSSPGCFIRRNQAHQFNRTTRTWKKREHRFRSIHIQTLVLYLHYITPCLLLTHFGILPPWGSWWWNCSTMTVTTTDIPTIIIVLAKYWAAMYTHAKKQKNNQHAISFMFTHK